MTFKMGLSHTLTAVVTSETTAKAVKSGTLEVLATPVLCAWMEQCCTECIQPALEEGETTVGTHIDLSHEAPTPLGGEVRIECFLRAMEGRKLTFAFTATDENGIIGRGTHQRFLVDAQRFQEKCDRKRKGE